MADSPVILLNLDPYPHYTAEFYPNRRYRGPEQQQRHNPINVHPVGMISASPKGAIKKKDHDFHINLDVGLYLPEELTVKIADDHVVIEGKHEERKADDVGFVSRHFIRRYKLPKGYNPDAILSKLSSDGVLSVLLPTPTDKPKERIITIQHPGPNDIFLRKNKPLKGDKDKTKNGVEEEIKG